MQSNPQKLFRFLIALVATLFIILFSLAIFFNSQVNERDDALAQSRAVNEIISAELEGRQATIVDLEKTLSDRTNQIASLESDVSNISGQLQDLELDIANRSCQSVSYAEFDRRIRLDNTYVVTTAEMGWTSYWSLRTDVLFENADSLARGYEVRYDLTPTTYSDDWQEMHTTIRAFSTSLAAASFFETKGNNPNKVYLDTRLDFGIPLKAWNTLGDSENTVVISMLCGNIQADLKLKLLDDTQQALAYLEEAATMLFHDISVWVPFNIEN